MLQYYIFVNLSNNRLQLYYLTLLRITGKNYFKRELLSGIFPGDRFRMCLLYFTCGHLYRIYFMHLKETASTNTVPVGTINTRRRGTTFSPSLSFSFYSWNGAEEWASFLLWTNKYSDSGLYKRINISIILLENIWADTRAMRRISIQCKEKSFFVASDNSWCLLMSLCRSL